MKLLKRAELENNPAKTERIIQDLIDTQGVTREEVEQAIDDNAGAETWVNSLYQVNVRRGPEITWLSIKRRDKQPIHDWRDLQDIKNQLVGPVAKG